MDSGAEVQDSGAARDAGVHVPVADRAKRFPDGVRTRCAGAGRREARALEAVEHRDLAGGEVRDRRRDEVRRDAVRPFFGEHLRRLFDEVESTEPHADDRPDAFALLVRRLEMGALDGHAARRDRKMDERVTLFDLLLLDPVFRDEAFHLTGEPDGVLRGVELRDRSDPALASGNAGPGALRVGSDRTHGSDSSNDDSAQCMAFLSAVFYDAL